MGRPRFSFKVTILVLFAVLTFALSGAVIYVSYARNSEATVLAADNLLEQSAARMMSAIDRLIDPMVTMADTIVLLPVVDAAVTEGSHTRDHPLAHPLAPILAGALDRFPQMASAYIANNLGDFYRIVSFDDDRAPARASLMAPPEAQLAEQSIASEPGQPRDARWRFIDARGMEIAHYTDEATSYDPRERPWYGAAQESAGVIVTDYYAFASVPAVGLTIAKKWGDPRGNVFAADLTLSSVSHYLSTVRTQQFGAGSKAEIALFHRDGRLLASSDETAFAYALSASGTPRIPTISEVGTGVIQTVAERNPSETNTRLRFTDAQGVDWLARVVPAPPIFGAGTFLAIAVPSEEFLGPLARSAQITLVVSLVIVLAFLPIVYLAANTISAPLGRVTKEIAAIRAFDLEPRLPVKSSIAEIQDLGHALATAKFMLGVFGKYVPKNLVRQIVDSEIEPVLGGERRPVTIFFSDVRDFTTISEQVPPERLMEFTSDYLEGLVTIILANQGTIDKFVGDQIMAYWNAPQSNPNHVADGCAALLRCRDWSNARNAQWEREGHPILYTRFALHLGDAIVGNVGSSDRMDYTVIGATINLGSRIEGLNKIYGTQVLITRPVADALDTRFVRRPVDRVLPKGAIYPLDVFELKGVHPDRAGDGLADLVVDADDVGLCDAWTGFYGRYLSRDWQAAEAALSRFTQRYGEDSLTRLYRTRLSEFLANPPPADWDGVIRYTEK